VLYGQEEFQLPVIQKVTLRDNPKDGTPAPAGTYYAYVWTSDAEAKVLKTMLGRLAQLGLIVAVSKPVYANMKA